MAIPVEQCFPNFILFQSLVGMSLGSSIKYMLLASNIYSLLEIYFLCIFENVFQEHNF